MGKRLKITRGGQVTVPAPVRRRWRTSTVVADDEGDRLVLRPTPEDPVEAVAGIFAAETAGQPSTKRVRELEREEEAEIEERRFG